MNMRATSLVLLVAGLVCLASGAEDCPGSLVSAKCSAAAAISITATNGTCKGRAGADCKVWTESQQRYEEEVKTWLSDENTENLCAGTTITATSQAIAQAVAAVWANSFVELECSGGFGCGWSLGNAAGYAASVAEAMSLAVADATESNEVSDSHAESFCFADVRAVGGAFVSAFAQAASDTCATFGDSVDYENSYALSVQSAIATALARATVSICRNVEKSADDLNTDLSANSLCEGEASVVREQDEMIATGDACAGGESINLCPSKGAKACCKGKKSKTACTFTSKQRKKCKECRAPWIRQKVAGDAVVYLTSKRERCLCDANA